MKERVNTMTMKKKTAATVETKNAVVAAATVETKKVAAVETKKVSNTQVCANMILEFAKAAKHTRNDIIASVSEALSALSIVTVRTMMSDLQNAKYAKRYSSHTISVDKNTKIVSIASEISV